MIPGERLEVEGGGGGEEHEGENSPQHGQRDGRYHRERAQGARLK